MNTVIIAGTEITPIEFNKERVVTYQMIADVHGVPLATVRDGYTRNAKYFVEGEDTYVIDYSKKTVYPSFEIPLRGLRVFTELGYLMLIKTLRDETAWKVQRELVSNYFRGRRAALPDFTNPAEAARAWASEYEQKLIAEEKLSIAAPKAEVYDRIIDRNNCYNATHVGQKVKMSARKLNEHLETLEVYNHAVKRGNRTFRQWFIDKGYGVMKETSNGYSQAMFTAEGEMWVVKTFMERGIV